MCTILGTHDIQNISITFHYPNEIIVTGDFTNGSTATGILTIVYSITNNSDVYYDFARYSSNQQRVIIGCRLPGDQYELFLYTMDENGLPFSRAAAGPRYIWINGNLSTILGQDINTAIFTQEHLRLSTNYLLSMISSPPPLVFASPVPSWTVLPPTVWQWYINESLSSALVD